MKVLKDKIMKDEGKNKRVSWRKRRKEVRERTVELLDEIGLRKRDVEAVRIQEEREREEKRRTGRERGGVAVGVGMGAVKSVSGKVNGTDYHIRVRDGRMIACKNPKQEVKGESLRTAMLMKRVNERAREEYRDEEKRLEWEKRYEESGGWYGKRYWRLWDYMRAVIRAEEKGKVEEE